ncbi:MAG: hypothetical protein ACXAC5_01095 [Promethearchaeota archaeon]|jgi:hypothetical protein
MWEDYLERMTLSQLAREYASYANDAALAELERRETLDEKDTSDK